MSEEIEVPTQFPMNIVNPADGGDLPTRKAPRQPEGRILTGQESRVETGQFGPTLIITFYEPGVTWFNVDRLRALLERLEAAPRD